MSNGLCYHQQRLNYENQISQFFKADFALPVGEPCLLLTLAHVSVQALPTVKTISGGPLLRSRETPQFPGFANGDTIHAAQYDNPIGMAVDISGEYLFIADRDNNQVRLIDFAAGNPADFGYTANFGMYTNSGTHWGLNTNMLSKPIGVDIDLQTNLFILNKGNGTNGYILQFNFVTGFFIATNMVNINNAGGLTEDANTNLYITANSNKVFKISVSTHAVTQIAAVSGSNCFLKGIVAKRNGYLAVCDYGRSGILIINPTNGVVTTNSGFNGVGDFSDNVHNRSVAGNVQYNSPIGITEAGDGSLIVTDFGNDRVKVVLNDGSVTNLYGVVSSDWTANNFPGWSDGTVSLPDGTGANVQCRYPNGVVYGYDGTVYVTEDWYHIIRKVTGAGLPLFPPPPQPPRRLQPACLCCPQITARSH